MNVMGRDDDSGAEFIQRLKKMQQALRHVGIDVARRFIRDQNLWPTDDGAGNANALLLAAGQGSRPRTRPVRQSYPGPHLPRSEERREGRECASKGRSRGSQYHTKKTQKTQ